MASRRGQTEKLLGAVKTAARREFRNKWRQSSFNCRRSGFRLGGRPFGSGAARRPSALAICRSKRASPSALRPFVAARSALAKSASPAVRNSPRYAF
jgi:hypothetical protein